MQLRLFDSMNDLSEFAASVIIAEINQNRNLLLCTATGNSTSETYYKLVSKKKEFTSEKLRVIKLDEWGGVPADHPMTCEAYLQKRLLRPLIIDPVNYISFTSDAEDPDQECERVQHLLDVQGPIDLCILGIGMNGHIAFNEPGDFLIPHCHKANLSSSSLNHPMVRETDVTPKYGLTLGMADILKSRKIILLISGKNKASVTRQLMLKKLDTQLPASFLWLHPDVHCFCDRDAFESR
jgi:galactosamine-6-phosphate isomerase